MAFSDHLKNAGVDEDRIRRITAVRYIQDKAHPKQDNANYMAAALRLCESELPDEVLSAVMFDRACCKGGFRLKNARQFARIHKAATLPDKLRDLAQVRYMGQPFINEQGDIQTNAVGSPAGVRMICPCWQLGGATPVDAPMPLSYCRCCGGHFQFHYQIALGLKLRLKQVVSSMLNSEGRLPCVFIYGILPAE